MVKTEILNKIKQLECENLSLMSEAFSRKLEAHITGFYFRSRID